MKKALEGMTQAKWDSLSPAQRDELRDTSDLHPMLIAYEGKKVTVKPKRAYGLSTFRVGRSTGWKPIHLALKERESGSCDIIGANEHFDSVTVAK